jgi:hypothetical protein
MQPDEPTPSATHSRWGCLGSIGHEGKDYFLWRREDCDGKPIYQLNHSEKIAPGLNAGGYTTLEAITAITGIVVPPWVA